MGETRGQVPRSHKTTSAATCRGDSKPGETEGRRAEPPQRAQGLGDGEVGKMQWEERSRKKGLDKESNTGS